MRAGLLVLVLCAGGCEFDVGGLTIADATIPLDDAAPARGDADSTGDASADLSDGAVDLSRIDASGGVLMLMKMPAPPMANLTMMGTRDWAHWGLTSASDFDHRLGTNILPDEQLINGLFSLQYGDNLTGFSWTDGTPHATATNSTTGIYVGCLGCGYELDIPADASMHTVQLFVGGYKADAHLDVSLSDGSAAAVSDDESNANDKFDMLYTIHFRAALPNQQLIVKWTETADHLGGNVTLQAAALKD